MAEDRALASVEALLARERGRLAELLDALPAVVGVFRGLDLIVELANPLYRKLAGDRLLVGRPVAEVFDEPANRPFIDLLLEVYRTGEQYTGTEMFRRGAAAGRAGRRALARGPGAGRRDRRARARLRPRGPKDDRALLVLRVLRSRLGPARRRPQGAPGRAPPRRR